VNAANADLYDGLGELLAYPGPGWRARAQACRLRLAADHEPAARLVGELLEAVRCLSVEDLQELYTRTFDLNPVAALEVGWHLYGEAYERGRFLVRTRQMLRDAGILEGSELPDHLTCLLPALGRLEPELAGPFAATYVLPALQRMLSALAGKGNPYETALAAVARVVEQAAQGFPREAPERPAACAFLATGDAGVPAGALQEDVP
jgi:nitrate reductase molybdenum cofactor assembly chaperone NarJ/NarW